MVSFFKGLAMAMKKIQGKRKAAKKAVKSVVKVRPKVSSKKMVKKAAKKVLRKTKTIEKEKPQRVTKKQVIQSRKESAIEAVSQKAQAEDKKSALKIKKPTKMSAKEKLKIEKLDKLTKKWWALYERSKQIKAPDYQMSLKYEEKSPLQHKILGWGFILSNSNDRLEVLFESGVKNLISNYQRS